MKTTFSPTRMEFTKRAHLAAQEQFYPRLFPNRPLRFEDTVKTVQDLEYAIDCQVALIVDDFKAPLRFAVQERWRNPDDLPYGDVTVTEWNLASNTPSELHKLGAHLFVYGFYDDDSGNVVLAVALNVATVLRKLSTGDLPYRRQSRYDQSFIGLGFRNLLQVGAVMAHVDNREGM